jgi:hypothetical protein
LIASSWPTNVLYEQPEESTAAHAIIIAAAIVRICRIIPITFACIVYRCRHLRPTSLCPLTFAL